MPTNARWSQTIASRMQHTYALCILSLFYLSLFGPLNGETSNHVPTGLKASIVLLLMSILIFRRDTEDTNDRLITWGASALVFIFLMNASWRIHSLMEFPNETAVNAQGWRPELAAAFHHDFLLYYAIFPCAMVLSWRLIRYTGDRTPWLLFICFTPSIFVATYQYHFDNQLLLRWPNLGFSQGLSTDSNALGLVSFLIAGLLLAEASFKPAKTKIRNVAGAMLCALACLFSESRIANFGMLLLFVFFATSQTIHQWGTKKTSIASLLLLAATSMLVLNHHEALYEATGGLGIKVKYTIQSITDDGPFMAFMKEKRGDLFRVGWNLLWKSPFIGWGPGGFYIQFSNEWMTLTGVLREVWDSVTNHYLMIAIDFGLPALFLYLSLMLLPVFRLLRAWKSGSANSTSGIAFLIFNLLVFYFLIIFVPPAYFPDCCWLMACAISYALHKANIQIQPATMPS